MSCSIALLGLEEQAETITVRVYTNLVEAMSDICQSLESLREI